MAAATTTRNTPKLYGSPEPHEYELPIAAATSIIGGTAVMDNGSGYLVEVAAGVSGTVIGRATADVDNSAGSAGDLNSKAESGCFRWVNGSSITVAHRYDYAYFGDNQTVHNTDGSGTYPFAGIIMDVDSSGVWVYSSPALGAAVSAAPVGAREEVTLVRGASTANIANLASFTVANDGITLVENDLFLAKDQTSADENGVYLVGTVAAGSAPLTRYSLFDDAIEVAPGAIVVVAEGTAGADTAWQLTADAPIVVGTSNLTFAQIPFGYGVAGSVADVTKAAATAGTSSLAARVDHKHNISTAAASSISDANAEGSATSLARSDHTHIVTSRVQVITKQIVVADLTASALSQTINFDATIPDGSQILGHSVILATPFTGGGASATTVDIGDAGDTDALIDGADVFTAAVDGEASAITLGIAPHKYFASATTLQAVVTSDVNVDTLTAGDMTLRVMFGVA